MPKHFVLKLAFCVLAIASVATAMVPTVVAQDSGVGPGEDLSTNPKERQTTVTATVPDIVSPSTPILIAPENDSLLQDGTPSFVWQIATDNVGIASYTLYIDGAVLFSGIPTSNTDNSSYTLTYNSTTTYYTLTPKSSIADGTHTWKVRAHDAAGNFTDSATWSFEIDTQAPSFVITKIEDETVSISAFDTSTIPGEPHQLSANQPTISGTGESGSTVKVTLSGKGITTSSTTFTIRSGGTWSWQLGVLPRDVTVYLDFVITDEAGNVSILNDVPLILLSEVISIPPGALPTPTPIPGHPGPLEPTPSPGISIPVLSPAEWRHEILDQARPYLPPSLQKTVEDDFLTPVVTPVQPQNFKRRLGALVLITPIAVSFGALALVAGPSLTIGMLWQLLLLLLPLFRRKYCSQVFTYQNSKGTPYVTVTYTQIGTDNPYSKSLMTTIHGYYDPGELPEGRYLVAVDQPGFPLELSQDAKQHSHWYLGEELLIEEHKHACLLIPVAQQKAEAFSRKFLIVLAELTSPRSVFRWLWVLLGGFLIFLYPSNVNVALFLLLVVVYALDTILASRFKD